MKGSWMPSSQHDFEELYQAHGRRLVVQLYAYTADLPLAQDLVQEAFCRALARWSRISSYDDPIGWVRRVAWNLAASHWRRTVRWRGVVEAHPPQLVPGPEPNRVALLTALSTLPVNQRRAVIMYYLGDLGISDIAEVEQATANTIKQRLHRARTALAVKLADSISEVGNA
jgi:RNA polymerase sigma-70 factor, ECF subfamily